MTIAEGSECRCIVVVRRGLVSRGALWLCLSGLSGELFGGVCGFTMVILTSTPLELS